MNETPIIYWKDEDMDLVLWVRASPGFLSC